MPDAVVSRASVPVPAPVPVPSAPAAAPVLAAAAPAASDSLGLVGERFAGKLAIIRHLGPNGVSEVYKAHHAQSNYVVFLRVARGGPSPRARAALQRFSVESRAACAVKHPNIASVIETGQHGTDLFVAQEFSPGPTLRQIAEVARDVPMPALLSMGIQVLQALVALHAQNVVVGTFEPRRVFLYSGQGGAGVVKLVDFSSAALLGEPPPPPEEDRAATQHFVKSARYYSPERIEGETPDPRSDLYSFGVLFYELLTGEFPYPVTGHHPGAYVASHLRQEPRPIALDGGAADVTGHVSDVLMRLLQKRPEKRYPTARAALRDIEDVVVPQMLRYTATGNLEVLLAWRRRIRKALEDAHARKLLRSTATVVQQPPASEPPPAPESRA